MSDEKSLTHSVWECKYHVVWIPKCRKKQLYGGVAKYLGNIFHELARERESRILEGHLCPDHVHMLIEIPPKYSVAQCDSNSPALCRAAEELHWTKLLGKRVLCNNSRA